MVIAQRALALLTVGALAVLEWACIGPLFPEATRYHVQYRVEGTVSACTVIYQTSYSIEETSHVELPWSYAFKPKCGMWMRLRAMKDQGDSGGILGAMLVDGAVVDSSDTVWGTYGIDLIYWLACP